MFCQKCLEKDSDVDQSMLSCRYCGRDLSEAENGTTLCESCADTRQRCQGCDQELRLGDFKGIFVCGTANHMARSDERKIIAFLLRAIKKDRALQREKGV